MKIVWEKTSLANLIQKVIDYRGKTPLKLGGDWEENNVGYRALSAKNIKTGHIVSPETIRYVNQALYDKWMKDEILRGDILITSEAPFGEVYQWNSDEKIVLSQRLFAIRANNRIHAHYLYYYLTTHKFQQEMRAKATGTTVIGLRQPELLKCIVYYPLDKTAQAQIASILQCIDRKIEINTSINRNLEQQAQAIFKSWFVDFAPFRDGKFMDSELGPIPAGWRVGTLEDIADITMGQSPKGESYNENSVGTVFYQGRAEFTDRFPVRRLFTTEPKRMATSGDVLLSVRAPVGDMNIANEPCCIGRGLATIHAKHGFTSFVFYTMQTLRQELDKYNGEGTVFGCINKDSLNALKVIIPPENIISVFEERTSPLDRKYFVGIEENMRLTKLRDTLLQKLMSGEIDVSEVEV